MANEFQTNDSVLVRLFGTTGRVLGPSDNPAWADAESTEPVYRVQMDDDGRVVTAGASSLEAFTEAPAETAAAEAAESPAEEAAREAPAEEATETPAEETAEAEAEPAAE